MPARCLLSHMRRVGSGQGGAHVGCAKRALGLVAVVERHGAQPEQDDAPEVPKELVPEDDHVEDWDAERNESFRVDFILGCRFVL